MRFVFLEEVLKIKKIIVIAAGNDISGYCIPCTYLGISNE